jgi:sulfonate transport system substrate-binding protein
MKRIILFMQLLIAVVVMSAAGVARADQPTVIRIAYAGVGIGNRPYASSSSAAVVHARGQLEEEFKKDNITIKWIFLPGAGPAVNEAFANGIIDFAFQGDLPAVIGKAGGLKTKLLLASGIRQHSYLAVPADSHVTSLADLKGKKVALFKGTNLQLAAVRILEGHGLASKDMREINMDTATGKAALLTKDIDAAWGGNDLLQLRDQGTAKIIYITKGDSPNYLRHSHLMGTEDFISKYPDITRRIVKQTVLAAQWIGQNEQNPTAIYNLWTKSGIPFNDFKEDDVGDISIKVKAASPLFDEYLTTRYKAAVADAKRFGLIRSTVDVDAWIDRSFLNAVLKELNLEHYWPEYDANGNQKTPGSS